MAKINVTVSEEMMKEIGALRKKLDISTDAELVREAIRVLRFFAGTIESNQDILIKEEDSDYLSRLVFPKYQTLRPKRGDKK